MMSVAGSQVDDVGVDEDEVEDEGPWWRDRDVLIPIGSGLVFLTGLILQWTGLELAALVLFWIALLLGSATFAPGAIRKLFGEGRLGIGLLMTISATGAVILGFVEEAAALAFCTRSLKRSRTRQWTVHGPVCVLC
ncbi:cadmium-translocating P-type ATPase (plasmid) [Streptomyces sp. L7]